MLGVAAVWLFNFLPLAIVFNSKVTSSAVSALATVPPAKVIKVWVGIILAVLPVLNVTPFNEVPAITPEIINKFDEKSKKNIKILVSGTGKGFTKLSLQKKLNSNFYLELIECCVELDGVSKDTYSNANETSKWVNKNKIKEILLITSNYHMPRSILEFNNIMPNLKILPYPIKPEQHKINEWLKSFETFSLVFIEYCKYIVSNIRVKTL